MASLNGRPAIRYVLLELLNQYPDGLTPTKVYEIIGREYVFPKEWYFERPTSAGYHSLKSLGYSDWESIPQSKLVGMVDTEPQWHYFVRWSREALKSKGELDISAPVGLWRLNENGRRAANQLVLESYKPEEIAIIQSRRTPRRVMREIPNKPAVAASENAPSSAISPTDAFPPTPTAVDIDDPGTSSILVHTYRVLRDTKVARRLKALHKGECQICGEAININGKKYCEAHHIKPLGHRHNGPDVEGNILILCPNHHVMCDYGAVRLEIGSLHTHPMHRIDQQFLNYHNNEIVGTR